MKNVLLLLSFIILNVDIAFAQTESKLIDTLYNKIEKQTIFYKVSAKTKDTILTILIKSPNIDSLARLTDSLNHYTRDKEWEYVLWTGFCPPAKIVKEYKFHFNKDGSSGMTIYGEELKRMPFR